MLHALFWYLMLGTGIWLIGSSGKIAATSTTRSLVLASMIFISAWPVVLFWFSKSR